MSKACMICIILGHWGRWTSCSNQCGQGTSIREWACNVTSKYCAQLPNVAITCESTQLCSLGNIDRLIVHSVAFYCYNILFLDCTQSHPHIGDGFCDDWFNWEMCGFDGGDCCLLDKRVNYCTDCFCLQENKAPFPNCTFEKSLGDGICDDFANNEKCAFDQG